MRAQEWDARYASAELVWGAGPNRFIAEVLGEVQPARALDVACGEGRNAIWLATRGWSATGVDFSSHAVERARRLADEAGVADRASFVVGDVVDHPLPAGPFDAAVIAYLHLPRADRRRVLAEAVGRLAPGGRLVVVGHDSSNLTDGVGGPQDPTILFTPQDIVSELPEIVTVERADRVTRDVAAADGRRRAIDALVVARRRGE